MVKAWWIIAVWAMPVALTAQNGLPFTGAGLLRASGGISPGFLLYGGSTNIYLNGKLEYFLEDRISMRGEGFWYVNSRQHPAPLDQNSQLAFGPFLHCIKGRLDLSAGVEAGLSFVHPANNWMAPLWAPQDPRMDPAPMRAVPTVAMCGSLNYAVWDYLHFFLDLRMVRSRYYGSPLGTLNLDELVPSAGLGWQFPVKHVGPPSD